MAGTGPPPKAKDERRNRVAPKRGEWVDLHPLKEPVLPERPAGEDDPWPAATRRAWEAWRADPVTSQYGEADIAYAEDTIELHAQMVGKPTLASEVRLRMDALGLTPKGKRDNRWRIATEDEPEEEPKSTRRRGSHSSRRRSHLTAVK